VLRRLFFINEDRTKYDCICFHPSRDNLSLVEFVVVRNGGGPKTIILNDEKVDAMDEGFLYCVTPCVPGTMLAAASAKAVPPGWS